MNTAMQLKALIRNISKQKKVNAQILLRNFMLERISLSKYKYNFILKGGMLIAAMVGIDTRSTMDMDATIKGIPVSRETIKGMFDDILDADINDSVVMSLGDIDDIRDEAEYTGFRVSINTNFDGIKQTLKIDITTGDTITPREIEYELSLMLENRSIKVLAYNLETILAEKLETIISRGTANTRMRDFYDIFILTKLQADNIDKRLLADALNETAKKRGTAALFDNKALIISEITSNSILQDLWTRYQKKFDYAGDVSWSQVMSAVEITLF